MEPNTRLEALRARLDAHQVDALLVTHMPNVQYLSGFTGSAGVLLAAKRNLFFTDGRYGEQARKQVTDARVSVPRGRSTVTAALEAARKLGVRRLGIEAEHMTVASRTAALRELKGSSIRLVETRSAVEHLRMVKDAGEIRRMRAAALLGCKLFPGLLKHLVPGKPEQAAAAWLEYGARKAGASAMSFETIVAGGARSALPHGVASAARLPGRGFVVLDYGVILDNYCSDMTRTVHIGAASADSKLLYQAVLEAQLAALSAVRPGVTTGEVDEAARGTLRRHRLAKYFTHSTGHGVGLEIHELPRVAAGQTTVLEPGMVITIEPGIYLAGRCGIRIEDTVVVTETGAERLTPVTKDLIEL